MIPGGMRQQDITHKPNFSNRWYAKGAETATPVAEAQWRETARLPERRRCRFKSAPFCLWCYEQTTFYHQRERSAFLSGRRR